MRQERGVSREELPVRIDGEMLNNYQDFVKK
ncbi:MAG: hypothetical protein DDT40_01764 [candidate division WS2 bacterium]|nr:hypothetical protein [Candidatus Psychracetigena formicireducens]